jgi:hypothetical protein
MRKPQKKHNKPSAKQAIIYKGRLLRSITMKLSNNRRTIIPLALLVIIVAFASILFTSATPSKAAPYVAQARPSQIHQGSVAKVQGASAIEPHGKPVTRDEVMQYISLTGIPQNISTDHHFTFMYVELLSDQIIEAKLNGEETGFPKTKQLWFAEVTGHFVFAGPPGVTVALPYAYEIFDPETGNVIMAGGVPKPIIL